MQQAESEYKGALANVEGLRKKLQLINIDTDKLSAENISSTIHLFAPISGYITKVNAIQGMFAEPTDVIFEIINTDHLHVKLKVYENDILKIKKGDKINFRIPETENKYYSGKVFLVGKIIEEEDRTVLVHCHITEEASLPVVAGMFVEASIIIGVQEHFCLPASAFIREENNYYVFINISDGNDTYTFKKVLLEVGEITEDCIEIQEKSRDIIAGKEILIEGAFNL
jgi:cobalt-zinc-cadmium efflux system membrane fusion protein